jgi:membrane peptidoglycan carboxypeptidase
MAASPDPFHEHESLRVPVGAIILPFPGERRTLTRSAAPRRKRTPWFVVLCLSLVLGASFLEARFCELQSVLFAHWSSKLQFAVASGRSDDLALPAAGPLDERRGYTKLGQFSLRLRENGFRIVAQARQSPELADLIRYRIAAPFRQPAVAGLVIRDADHTLIYDAAAGDSRRLESFPEIPPLLVRSLLFIENRNIGDEASSRANPAIDWARSSKAFALYVGRSVGFGWPLEGGSTLATQLVKFQHSPGGRTESPLEKLRQMIGASLWAYHEGPDTRTARREIILDYLNTVPLGAAAGIGEVNGVPDGLRVWFAENPRDVFATLRYPSLTPETARAYKEVLALLYSVHAPTFYLEKNRRALESRVDAYSGLLQSAGVIDAPMLELLRNTTLEFASAPSPTGTGEPASFIARKAPNFLRAQLGGLLGVTNQYGLDRLDVRVDSTIDSKLQAKVTGLLRQLAKPEFVTANSLREPHVLERGDPGGVTYSFLLVESRPEGNLVRVHTDTLDAPFDVNDGMKLELGSTAKLRTLAQYLEIIAQLHDELAVLDHQRLEARATNGRDPLTRWAAATLLAEPQLDLEAMLAKSLERSYSASPEEEFFTGGGLHHFGNFEPQENDQVLTIRAAFIHSTNLVFVRLMRDIVRYTQALLPYDADAVLRDVDFPARKELLKEIAAEEYRKSPNAAADWLLSRRNREAQDIRLRIRIERDAFARMTPYWRRLGFPFETLVPSYATAIGSSADRPAALADLMGIIVNDGWRRPLIDIQQVRFAHTTPYETTFERYGDRNEQVMRTPVARLLRSVLAGVVDSGTAVRLKHAFDAGAAAIVVGGKTGSGDNRFDTFSRDGHLLTSRAVSRTGSFVFYLGDRWFGVITAAVAGPQSANYTFTSSLPLAALKLLAPTLSAAVSGSDYRAASTGAQRP